MATSAGKSGKCSNFGNCTVADTRKIIEVAVGMDFVCSECHKPLLLTSEAAGSASSKAPIMAGVLLLLLLLGGAGSWYFVLGGKKHAAQVPEPSTVIQEPPSKTPLKSASGDCSPTDKKAGLCR